MSKSYPVVKRIDNNPVAGDVPTDTSGFSNVLGASDLDVQKALDSLDDILDGSNATEILYNEAGRPVGDSGLTYDDATGVVTIDGVQIDGPNNKVISDDDFALDCGTEKTLRLVEPVYDDLPPAGFLNARIPPSNAPTWTTFLSGGVNEQYRFSVNDYLLVTPIETTHKYREGADFSLHLHWSTGQGTDGTDRAVKWEVTYTIADGNEAFASEVTISAEETIPASTVANTHLITGIGTITGTNFKIGAYIIATVKRIAATGTAPSNDPYGLALGVHVEQDTMGSRQLFIK